MGVEIAPFVISILWCVRTCVYTYTHNGGLLFRDRYKIHAVKYYDTSAYCIQVVN